MGWIVWGLNSGRSKRFYLTQNHPDHDWGPPSLLFNEYQGSFLGVKVLGREVDHSPPSSIKVKMSDAVPVLPHMPSWHEQGQLYVSYLFKLDVHLQANVS
jgi:hypothetical protein